MTLQTLTDRDLLINLYVAVLMLSQMAEVEPETCQQQLLTAGDQPSVSDDITTLAELMAETADRLGIDAADSQMVKGHMN
jgi:hypothetical protein